MTSRSFAFAAGPAERLDQPQRSMALGIAKASGRDDYQLAVRIQRRLFDGDTDLREKIVSLARGEAEIRYIGRVVKQMPAEPTPPWQRTRQRPLLLGSSIGHYAVTAGTLGTFAVHRASGSIVVLSNNHVLANEDRAQIGDVILQPGVYDGGNQNSDRIGTLLAAVPLNPQGANLVDGAISKLDSGIQCDVRTITGFGALQGLRAQRIEPGDAVLKLGRTTGLTTGTVRAIELDDVVIEYDRFDRKFDQQIEIEGSDAAFSAGGDSGSLIVDTKGFACGLLFAGSDQGGANGQGLTYANDLSQVFASLNLALAPAPTSS